MSHKVALKITEKDGSKPNVNIPKTFRSVLHEGYSYHFEGNKLLLEATVPSEQIATELKRRLSAKRNRRGTVVEVVSGGEEVR